MSKDAGERTTAVAQIGAGRLGSHHSPDPHVAGADASAAP